MAGVMGGKHQTTRNLIVFKTDYEKSLLFIRGAVPGAKGAVIQVFDAMKKSSKQFEKLNFPTFLQEEGKVYPNVMEWTESVDMFEKRTHDNDEVLGVSEEEDESKGAKEVGEDEDEASMKKAAV